MYFTSSSTEGSHETKQEADRSWPQMKAPPGIHIVNGGGASTP